MRDVCLLAFTDYAEDAFREEDYGLDADDDEDVDDDAVDREQLTRYTFWRLDKKGSKVTPVSIVVAPKLDALTQDGLLDALQEQYSSQNKQDPRYIHEKTLAYCKEPHSMDPSKSARSSVIAIGTEFEWVRNRAIELELNPIFAVTIAGDPESTLKQTQAKAAANPRSGSTTGGKGGSVRAKMSRIGDVCPHSCYCAHPSGCLNFDCICLCLILHRLCVIRRATGVHWLKKTKKTAWLRRVMRPRLPSLKTK